MSRIAVTPASVLSKGGICIHSNFRPEHYCGANGVKEAVCTVDNELDSQ